MLETINFKKINLTRVVVVYTAHPSAWEAEAGGSIFHAAKQTNKNPLLSQFVIPTDMSTNGALCEL